MATREECLNDSCGCEKDCARDKDELAERAAEREYDARRERDEEYAWIQSRNPSLPGKPRV